MLLLALLLTFNLGDFRLESGEVIQNCRIGYRVDGALNAERSNAILIPTWFAGRSADLASQVGPGKMFDTSKYFVIVVDALGDGVSSSPSNSGGQLPRFTMRDMVRSQYELVTRELKLEQLYAVAGSSMGGMQAFQWVASYPDFMKKAISITGTPKQTSHDILLWKTQLDLIESAEDKREAMRVVAGIQSLELSGDAEKMVRDARSV
jgi:homoserine acetyltransferase